MKFFHYDLEIQLDDGWWTESGMEGFVPTGTAYRVDPDQANGKSIMEIRIDEISPVRRNPGTSIFNDGSDGEGSAKNRVVRILRGFVAKDKIPPVEVVPVPSGNNYRFKLTHGVHRLYCSLASGYSHVPAVQGFDWNSLDQ